MRATGYALARFDPKRALGLLGSIEPPFSLERDPVGLAYALAATDPARAVALGDSLAEQLNYHYLVRTEVTYRIGAERPTRPCGSSRG